MKKKLIYNGECIVCGACAKRLPSWCGDKVDVVPFQEVLEQFQKISRSDFEEAVHFSDGEGHMSRGAEAIFRALSGSPLGWLLWIYKKLPGAKFVFEKLYRFFSYHGVGFRLLKSWIAMGGGWRETYQTSAWFFRRSMGLIYLFAFWSLLTQIQGLYGSDGILPAESYLSAVHDQMGSASLMHLPSIFWISSTDFALTAGCWIGVILSLLLIMGILPLFASASLWILYLSYLNISQVFLNFQWDILLLEAGFLTIFLSPFVITDRIRNSIRPSQWIVFLVKWLLFRLMILSGIVKLLSGDPAWHDLTALTYHYETQPLPHVLSWWMDQAPVWLHIGSCLIMFVIELVAPFFLFAARRLRHVVCFFFVLFQIIIILTGNYCFFNLLVVVLCLFCLEDAWWQKRKWFKNKPAESKSQWPGWIIVPLACVILVSSTSQMFWRVGFQNVFVKPGVILARLLNPWHLTSTYGLFSVMTRTRPEIIIEGSMDGQTWKPYIFRYKPGDVTRTPGWVVPHQPRLDWQMWFAALGSYERSPWFFHFMRKLFENSPAVTKLLESNPFVDQAPRHIRASLYDYQFTDITERSETGAWWKRKYLGLFCPILSRDQFMSPSRLRNERGEL